MSRERLMIKWLIAELAQCRLYQAGYSNPDKKFLDRIKMALLKDALKGAKK